MTEVPEERRERIADDPFCATLGVELRELAPGRAVTALDVEERHRNFHGTLHGGALYGLADAAFAAASNAGGDTSLALETNVSYLAAVEVGTTLLATAVETHASTRTAAYEVRVERETDGDPVAAFRGRVYRPDG